MVTGNGRMQQIAEPSKCLRTWYQRSFEPQVDIGFAQRKVIRVTQYFCCMVLRAQGQSSGGRTRAVAANSGPVILPRREQGAIRTWGLFRMRLYFPESLRVIT